MRKSGLPVPVAALLSGVLAAGAAAQETGREHMKLPPGAVVAAKTNPRGGNPLWAIPVTQLSETQARPLFSPSRRPPAPAVVAAPAAPPPNAGPPSRREADHPLLTLLGTIVGGSLEIGVFADEASHDVIRLKAGEAHDGWTLRAVSGRAATFEKQGFRATTLVLPTPRAEANAPSVAVAPDTEPVATPGSRPITGVPPAKTFAPPVIPAATKGGSRRPPREG